MVLLEQFLVMRAHTAERVEMYMCREGWWWLLKCCRWVVIDLGWWICAGEAPAHGVAAAHCGSALQPVVLGQSPWRCLRHSPGRGAGAHFKCDGGQHMEEQTVSSTCAVICVTWELLWRCRHWVGQDQTSLECLLWTAPVPVQIIAPPLPREPAHRLRALLWRDGRPTVMPHQWERRCSPLHRGLQLERGPVLPAGGSMRHWVRCSGIPAGDMKWDKQV